MEHYDELEEWILSQVTSGESQASIAKALGVDASTLSRAMNANEERSQRSAYARIASAEAWLDKGMAVLHEAMTTPSYQGTGLDAGAARAIAQECARRAAIRNPAYRDKAEVALTGANGGPIRTIAATVTPEQAAAVYKELLG